MPSRRSQSWFLFSRSSSLPPVSSSSSCTDVPEHCVLPRSKELIIEQLEAWDLQSSLGSPGGAGCEESSYLLLLQRLGPHLAASFSCLASQQIRRSSHLQDLVTNSPQGCGFSWKEGLTRYFSCRLNG